jgi:WD40 repeat protein
MGRLALESRWKGKWLLAIGASLAAVALLVLVEGALLKTLGLISFRKPPHASVFHFSIDPSQESGLSLYWVRDSIPRASRRTYLRLHDLPLGGAGKTFQWKEISPQSAAWTGQDRQTAIGSAEGTIYTWDASNPAIEPQPLGLHPGSAMVLAASRDGRWLLAASDLGITAWDLSERQLRWQRSDCIGYGLAIHPISQNVVFGAVDGRIWELRLESGCTVRNLSVHNGAVDHLAVSPDGRRLASVGFDRRLIITDWDTAATIWSRQHLPNGRVCFSLTGENVISSSFEDDGAWSLLVWDTDRGQQQSKLIGHKKMIIGLAVAADGTLYSWSTDGTLRQWDLPRKAQINSFYATQADAC